MMIRHKQTSLLIQFSIIHFNFIQNWLLSATEINHTKLDGAAIMRQTRYGYYMWIIYLYNSIVNYMNSYVEH